MSARSVLTLCCIILFAGCGDLRELPTEPGGGADPIDPAATFARVQNEIFTPSCAIAGGCHDDFIRQEGLDLSAGRAYASIVGQPSIQRSSLQRVRPGDPAASYLYLKVLGSPTIVGDRMPQGRTPLTGTQLNLIRDWIRRGAPND